MSEDLPLPPVPPGAALHSGMPLPFDLLALRTTPEWMLANSAPELGFYIVNLWAAAAQFVPAGGLPDDDALLSRLAGCKPRRWSKLRSQVMARWYKASDGRLYHPLVNERAGEALSGEERQDGKRPSASGAVRQARYRAKLKSVTEPRNESVTSHVTESDGALRNAVTVSDVTGDVTLRRHVTDSVTEATPPSRVVTSPPLMFENPPENPPSGGKRGSLAEPAVTLEPPEKPPPKRATRLSPDWEPPTSLQQFALDHGLSLEDFHHEVDKFRDHFTAKSGQDATKHDWTATARNWLRRGAEQRPRATHAGISGASYPGPRPRGDREEPRGILAAGARVAARMEALERLRAAGGETEAGGDDSSIYGTLVSEALEGRL